MNLIKAEKPKESHFNLQEYIANQAINYDKLKWNRKDLNFALFWPAVVLLRCLFDVIYGMFLLEFSLIDPALLLLIVGVPILYMCWRGYVFAMFVAVGVFWSTNYACMLFATTGFYLATLVELCRQNQGLVNAKDWKKDLTKALFYDSIFIILWLYYNVPFIWYLMTENKIELMFNPN